MAGHADKTPRQHALVSPPPNLFLTIRLIIIVIALGIHVIIRVINLRNRVFLLRFPFHRNPTVMIGTLFHILCRFQATIALPCSTLNGGRSVARLGLACAAVAARGGEDVVQPGFLSIPQGS